jgi:outer membrane murein-binding lipoprotein Lpp
MFAVLVSWSRRSGLLLLVLALCMAAPATLARAAGPAEADQRLQAIRIEMEKGQALFLGGDYAAAASVFESGYAAYPYSAFLFNAGVCHQKLHDLERALADFKAYVHVDQSAPDVDKVNQRIAALEAARAGAASEIDAGVGEATPPSPTPSPVSPTTYDQSAMKSLVVIETEPDGAPLRVYARSDANALPFQSAGSNPGWNEVVATTAPASLTLDIGHYHVLVEKFRDFNQSEADMDVLSGHVHQLKANLSQGRFMAFLRVSANVIGAHVWLDDPHKRHSEWGETPHGELIPGGPHVLLLEVPGFEPLLANVDLQHGEQKELEARLSRVGFGLLRIDASAAKVELSIDDQPNGVWHSGEEPLEVRVDAGRHRLTVTGSGRKTYEGTIEVPRGQVLPLHVTMVPKFPRGAAWTQAAIGAVLLGGAIYAGSASNHLHDQLLADRQSGILESSDDRAARGRWFAIGADAGFAAASLFGLLSGYNFVRDPLPGSSMKRGKFSEFDDPLRARPVARSTLPSESIERVAGRPDAPALDVLPRASSSAAGLVWTGHF